MGGLGAGVGRAACLHAYRSALVLHSTARGMLRGVTKWAWVASWAQS